MQWQKALEAGRGVPSAVVVNSKGKVVSRISGYAPENVYISKLEKIVK
jgi:thioredoxin-related protein